MIHCTNGYSEDSQNTSSGETAVSSFMCTFKLGDSMIHERTDLFARYTADDKVQKSEFIDWLSSEYPEFSHLQCFSMQYHPSTKDDYEYIENAGAAAVSEHMAIEFALGNISIDDHDVFPKQLTDTAHGCLHRDQRNREIAIGFSRNIIMSEGETNQARSSQPLRFITSLPGKAMAKIITPCLGCMKHYIIETPWSWTTWLTKKTLPLFLYQRIHLVLASVWYGPEMENTYQLKIHDE